MNARKFCCGLSAGFILAAMSSSVEAAPVLCGGDVQFSLEVTSGSIESCLTGNGSLQNLPSPYDVYSLLDTDTTTSDNPLVGQPQEGWFDLTSNTFSIHSDAWVGHTYMALLLHLPTPSPKPDWAIFILSGGVTGGTWSSSGPRPEGLEFASLYRDSSTTTTPTPTTPVPEPASLSLLGIGLTGLIARRFRNRKLS